MFKILPVPFYSLIHPILYCPFDLFGVDPPQQTIIVRCLAVFHVANRAKQYPDVALMRKQSFSTLDILVPNPRCSRCLKSLIPSKGWTIRNVMGGVGRGSAKTINAGEIACKKLMHS